MSYDEALKLLDIEIEKRFYQLKKKELTNLLQELVKTKDKKSLAQLISDNNYFNSSDIIKALYKKAKPLLFKILNEPKKEEDLRQPIANWLKERDYFFDYEVKFPGGRRKIDVVGCKSAKIRGLIGEDRIIAFELKTTATRSAIDSAFSQANDYIDCSNWAYVAISPYVFIKYSDILLRKVKRYKNEVGLILVDKLRVISHLQEAKSTYYDDKKYETIINHFKQHTS